MNCLPKEVKIPFYPTSWIKKKKRKKVKRTGTVTDSDQDIVKQWACNRRKTLLPFLSTDKKKQPALRSIDWSSPVSPPEGIRKNRVIRRDKRKGGSERWYGFVKIHSYRGKSSWIQTVENHTWPPYIRAIKLRSRWSGWGTP